MGFDPEAGSSALRLWVAAGSAASLLAVCIFTIVRSRIKVASAFERTGVVVAGALLGAVASWAFLDRSFGHDNDADRRALELRAEELTAHALAPGSALPCLDALAGDDVEAACEKSLFGSAASVAVASSYVTARLDLLSDMVAYVKRGGGNIDTTLVPLRRAVEADRFGFLAHALAIRDSCTSQQCKVLAVLGDPSHVRANLGRGTLDHYLEYYVAVWAQPVDSPATVAAAAAAAAAAAQAPPRKIVNIDFPTAASIPAVSIMNPEPGSRSAGASAAAASANPQAAADTAAAAAQKRPRKQAANPIPPPPPAPAQAEAPADPVWTPAPPAPPAGAAPAVPAASMASGPSGPMQLMPSPRAQ